MLDQDFEKSAKFDNIVVEYYNEAGNKWPARKVMMEVSPQEYRPEQSPYINHYHCIEINYVTTDMTIDQKFLHDDGTSGKYVVKWGNGYGEDNISYRMEDYKEPQRICLIEKVWVNDILQFERLKTPRSVDHCYVVIQKK